jgi:hypothetical protein
LLVKLMWPIRFIKDYELGDDESYNKKNNVADGVLLRTTWDETLTMFFKKCCLMSVGDCLYMQHLSMVDWIKLFKSYICKFKFYIY